MKRLAQLKSLVRLSVTGVRSMLRLVIATVLVFCFISNTQYFYGRRTGLPLHWGPNEISVWEDRSRGIRDALLARNYRSGPIAYMPSGVLHGHPRTKDDDVAWNMLRYVMIPLDVRQDTLDAPYVIEDYSAENAPYALPEGFVGVLDVPGGLTLLQRRPSP
jgi:hypothetical protein